MIVIGDPICLKIKENIPILLEEPACFSRLKATRQEVESISNTFPNVTILLDSLAHEVNVKAYTKKHFNIWHFSTHGEFNDVHPSLMGLQLTKISPFSEDGILYAFEILNLNFQSELIVLSACQTGEGKLVKGEGLLALTRAFMYAGTSSIIVSLWRVEDEGSADLFKYYYKHLKAKGKYNALRAAQLKMINAKKSEDENKYANPFYWAPFVFIGKL